MQNIQQNPFRLIGVYAHANQRALKRQQGQIRAFQKVGKPLNFPSDLPFAGPLHRTEEDITAAFARIEKDQSRLEAGHFWFVNGSHVDEAALTHLEAGNVEKAMDMWNSQTANKEVTDGNKTAFHNQSTLLLALAGIASQRPAEDRLRPAIELRLKLMNSVHFPAVAQLITSPTFAVDTQQEIEYFSLQLLNAATSFGYSSTAAIQSLFTAVSPDVSATVTDQLTEGPMHVIEMAVAEAGRVRTQAPAQSIEQGNKLFIQAKTALAELATVAGREDVKYITAADKAANEVLQCGVSFFRHHENNLDAIPENTVVIKDLFEKARTLAATEITQQRIKQNIAGLDTWRQGSAMREEEQKVSAQVSVITAKLQEQQSQVPNLGNTSNFLKICESQLEEIKEILGEDSLLYQQLSSAVANNAMGMLIRFVNTRQANTTNASSLPTLRRDVQSAMRMVSKIGNLRMLPEHRQHYNKNVKGLTDLTLNLKRTQEQVSRNSGDEGADAIRIILFVIGLIIFLLRLLA